MRSFLPPQVRPGPLSPGQACELTECLRYLCGQVNVSVSGGLELLEGHGVHLRLNPLATGDWILSQGWTYTAVDVNFTGGTLTWDGLTLDVLTGWTVNVPAGVTVLYAGGGVLDLTGLATVDLTGVTVTGFTGADKLVACTAADTTPGYLYTDKLVAGTGIALAVENPGADEDVKVSAADTLPRWTDVTKTYADFSGGGTTTLLTLYTLAAREVLHAAILEVTQAAAGGGITTYTYELDLGANQIGNTVNGMTLNAFTQDWAYGKALGQLATYTGLVSTTATTDVKVRATCDVGHTLSMATAGSIKLSLLVSKLP
jgi:hypothetical protein